MRARIVPSLARVIAATTLVFIVGLNARPADAQYCGGSYTTYGCGGYGYGYGGYGGGFPYSYYSAFGYTAVPYSYGYPYSSYGYPLYAGTLTSGYYNTYLGAYPYYSYPTYTNSAVTYGYFGSPNRGYPYYGFSSVYGLPTMSMINPMSLYWGTGKEYCFPC